MNCAMQGLTNIRGARRREGSGSYNTQALEGETTQGPVQNLRGPCAETLDSIHMYM